MTDLRTEVARVMILCDVKKLLKEWGVERQPDDR